jgi:hypothetical protein
MSSYKYDPDDPSVLDERPNTEQINYVEEIMALKKTRLDVAIWRRDFELCLLVLCQIINILRYGLESCIFVSPGQVLMKPEECFKYLVKTISSNAEGLYNELFEKLCHVWREKDKAEELARLLENTSIEDYKTKIQSLLVSSTESEISASNKKYFKEILKLVDADFRSQEIDRLILQLTGDADNDAMIEGSILSLLN